MTWHLHVEGHTDDPAEEQSLKEKVVAFVHDLRGKHTVTGSSFSGPTVSITPHTEPVPAAAPTAQSASAPEPSAPEPSAPGLAAEEPAAAAPEGRAAPVESVDLDEADRQVAAWRQEDEALLGEAPEVAPVPTAEEVPPPASAAEGEIAALRQEDEALLGEAPEVAPAPTAKEPPAASGS
jgi:hypothetical protein